MKRGYNSLEKNASSTEEVLTIMMKKHHVHCLELEAAKEEIAVKVAQVKQYQKQVEAYKQQLEQVNVHGWRNTHVKMITCM